MSIHSQEGAINQSILTIKHPRKENNNIKKINANPISNLISENSHERGKQGATSLAGAATLTTTTP